MKVFSSISLEGYDSLVRNGNGFEQSDSYGIFCRRESRYFSLQGFFEDVINIS
jgi:hypothetical protein